jgi:DNA repair exonuclease SbcCD ATPase subunit
MWQAVDLAKRTENKTLGGFSESQRSDLKLLQIDQEPLIDEVKPHVTRLDKLAKETIDGPTVERAKQAARQAQEGGWEAALNAAIKELQAGKLMSGASNQRRARDQFREIARLLILSQGEVESLRQAMRELEQAIDEQKEVMANTKRLENKDRDNKLALKQAEMVDGTDLVARDIESLAPVASEYLKNAIDKMQEARAALETEKDPAGQREKAPPKQAEAIAGMEQARKALQEQLTKAEEKGTKPENSLAELKNLQEEVKDLAKQEQKLKSVPTMFFMRVGIVFCALKMEQQEVTHQSQQKKFTKK